MKRIFFCLLLTSSFFLCQAQNKSLIIKNESRESIMVEINSEKFVLAPGSEDALKRVEDKIYLMKVSYTNKKGVIISFEKNIVADGSTIITQKDLRSYRQFVNPKKSDEKVVIKNK